MLEKCKSKQNPKQKSYFVQQKKNIYFMTQIKQSIINEKKNVMKSGYFSFFLTQAGSPLSPALEKEFFRGLNSDVCKTIFYNFYFA